MRTFRFVRHPKPREPYELSSGLEKRERPERCCGVGERKERGSGKEKKNYTSRRPEFTQIAMKQTPIHAVMQLAGGNREREKNEEEDNRERY